MSLNRSILSTALTGASGAGGTLIYHHAIPWTWTEVLIKDGCYFLHEENEYKAVWSEHKTTLIKKISELASIVQEFKKEQIHKWCETQLKKTYERNLTSYDKISNLCTNKGITTVKARLIYSGHNDFIVDEEEEKEREKLYKAAFGIYRYYDKFIIWIKKFNKSSKVKEELKKETVVDTGWKALDSACETELKRPHKGIEDVDYYTQVSWWCKKLKYKTVEELVKAKDTTWEFDGTGTNKGDKWKNTPTLIERYGNGNNKQEKIKSLTDSLIGERCRGLKSRELSDNDAYTHTYLILRYVCRKDSDATE